MIGCRSRWLFALAAVLDFDAGDDDAADQGDGVGDHQGPVAEHQALEREE